MRDTAAHRLFAEISLIYILWACRHSPATSSRYPLILYASRYWPYHYHLSVAEERQRIEYTLIMSLFDSTSGINMTDWLGVYNPDSRRPPSYAPAIYYSSLLGLVHITKWLIDNGADVNETGGQHANALQAAAFAGREVIVQLLWTTMQTSMRKEEDMEMPCRPRRRHLMAIQLLFNCCWTRTRMPRQKEENMEVLCGMSWQRSSCSAHVAQRGGHQLDGRGVRKCSTGCGILWE